jgi:hypothetical protein
MILDKSEKQLVTCIALVLVFGIIFQFTTYKALKKKYNQE